MLVAELEDYEGRVAASQGGKQATLYRALRRRSHPRIAAWRGLRSLNRDPPRGASTWITQISASTPTRCRTGRGCGGNLLGLMLAHAWLEQRTEGHQPRDRRKGRGRTPEDYEAAYGYSGPPASAR